MSPLKNVYARTSTSAYASVAMRSLMKYMRNSPGSMLIRSGCVTAKGTFICAAVLLSEFVYHT